MKKRKKKRAIGFVPKLSHPVKSFPLKYRTKAFFSFGILLKILYHQFYILTVGTSKVVDTSRRLYP